MKISVIGLGYIGLPTATMFASRGVEVLGVDTNSVVVRTVNDGRIHIVEPELDALVSTSVQRGFLRAALAPEPADAFLIAVPTPFKDGNEPDLAYVEAAARSVAKVLARGNVVILESTSPVGATERLVEWMATERPDLRFPVENGGETDVHVAYCPERVLPGHVVRELVENDRVIGGLTPTCSERAKELYRTFVEGELVTTSARTAEMCKLTENAYRDVNIAFANELSIICDDLGIDVWELIRLANRHPRVEILRPGCGVGGHCIAVDPWFIVSKSPRQARLIRTAREVNDGKPHWVVQRILDELAGLSVASGREPGQMRVACYGLAFKPNIDDLRESPAIEVVSELAGALNSEVFVVEPHIETGASELQGVELVGLRHALESADLNVILVAHDAFKEAGLFDGSEVLDFTGILGGKGR
ncbi:UDP-N-acetyl-D-mannosamine dehydrogenase [Luteimonas sp. RD2P54]|uniref:UDP-N-acetyl-D-mannosamine dehydrogenase n=1 Tax=Luteimonas endophytica TaxID=3042023 RepID=A0ABT6J9W7_9GAMM|nr:UDP-N-acetyl-D-mannosamine dehydrogenase [Luteimonas endophytica]MDH5822988.1 UDP-N-acetyl-D-mannosamine dehydrogenase [Luteimonas endophytica]